MHIRVMNASDVPLGMRLKNQTGWNQTETDWRRFIDLQAAGSLSHQQRSFGIPKKA